MGMDLYYHAFEKVGDFPLSGTVTTAFAAGAPVGLHTDGGVMTADSKSNVIGLAKVTRAAMASAGPVIPGGANYGSASFVTGVVMCELLDNSVNDAADGSPMNEALSAYTNQDLLYFAASAGPGLPSKWTRVRPGTDQPFGRVLQAAANSNLGGAVAYFVIVPMI